VYRLLCDEMHKETFPHCSNSSFLHKSPWVLLTVQQSADFCLPSLLPAFMSYQQHNCTVLHTFQEPLHSLTKFRMSC
jgi:hypothetical protein